MQTELFLMKTRSCRSIRILPARSVGTFAKSKVLGCAGTPIPKQSPRYQLKSLWYEVHLLEQCWSTYSPTVKAPLPTCDVRVISIWFTQRAPFGVHWASNPY